MTPNTPYSRYEIHVRKADNIVPHPRRFDVKVDRLKLAKHIGKEIFQYWGKWNVVLSRPCVYGVFSGPVGGFAPRQELCVGCLRCTTEHPDMVTVSKHPERTLLGDSFFTCDYVDTVVYEAESGRVPIKGAGYRGSFGGTGWDGMWTDMSEIVRPTRDGIHSREAISSEVDIGSKPSFLELDKQHQPIGSIPETVSIQLPMLFDVPPKAEILSEIFSEAARELQTFAIMPLAMIQKHSLILSQVIPLISPDEYQTFIDLNLQPAILEMSQWDKGFYERLKSHFPNTILMLRTDYEDPDLLSYYRAGARVFHLIANYHGRGKTGMFVLDMIRKAHLTFVKAKCRGEVTLVGSGGIIAAEHVPKAILCGLDAVALDTPLYAALQVSFNGECISQEDNHFQFSSTMTTEWGKQRLVNLIGSWRDQLLEVMGAMGLRDVRRLRGEMGRAMFQKELENQAFAGIIGYEIRKST